MPIDCRAAKAHWLYNRNKTERGAAATKKKPVYFAYILTALMKAFGPNIIAMKYKPSASELIDHYILECTKDNIEQARTVFCTGRPGGYFSN